MAVGVLCVLLILIGCTPVAAQIHDTMTPLTTQTTTTGATVPVTPHMDIGVATADDGAITVNCTLLPDPGWMPPDDGENVEIDLVRVYSPEENRASETLASAGADNQVVKHVSRGDVYVDGYFNTTAAWLPYVSVTIRAPVCGDAGLYYCALNTTTGAQVLAQTNVTVCSDIARLERVTTNSTPAHSVVTCRLAGNQSVRSISFMQISWQTARASSRIPLAYANVSENGGLAMPLSDFSGRVLRVSGQINPSRPEESQLGVEFPSERCEDTATGTFDCLVKYTEANSSVTRFSGANLLMPHDRCDDQQVDIRVTMPAEELEAMTVTCTLLSAELARDLSYFEVRRRRHLPGDYDTDENLASVGSDNSIRNNVYWTTDVEVEGHFDYTGATASYISVSFRKLECDDRGVYGCFVTSSNGSTISAMASVTVCNNITEMTQVISDSSSLTPSTINCRVSANQNVSSISSMQISWRRTENSIRQPLVFANQSENGGLAILSPSFSGRGFRVFGQINQTRPEESQLVAEFPSDSCENIAAGIFDCFLKYSDDRTSLLARSQLEVSDPCVVFPSKDFTNYGTRSKTHDEAFPQILITQRTEFNPTSFEVFCGNPNGLTGTLVTMELSLLSDRSPSVRRQIAYLDSFSAHSRPTVTRYLAEEGVTGVTYTNALNNVNQFSVSFSAGTCEDTGIYRCTAVYMPMDAQTVKVKISEARLPACLPYAVASVESSNTDGGWSDKFVCRVNSTLALELVSMEVSVIRNGSRLVLAYINSFLNGAKVGYISDEVHAEGEIYPFDPNASSLNVTSSVSSSKGASLHTVTCKVLLSGTQADPDPVIAMADGQLRLRQ